MGDKSSNHKNNLIIKESDRRSDILFVQDNFNIKSSIEHLHLMMKEVTKGEFNAANVNAACNCVHQINQVINTTIGAARFLKESKDAD